MEVVIFVGLQGSGKSTFYLQRFFRTHMRINLDMLRTRYRERLLFQACLDAKQAVVVDNTNPTRAERQVYIDSAIAVGFRVIGYTLRSPIAECLRRNDARPADQQVPHKALFGTSARLEWPTLAEGFDQLHDVWINDKGEFVVEE